MYGLLGFSYSALPPMISYAQQAEDVVLRRALWGLNKGFYVDIGAGSPETGSVTRHFYEQGWHGINVEPQPWLHEQLSSVRLRDINLPVAIAASPGQTTLTTYPEAWGLATTDEDVRMMHARAGVHGRQITVATRPLEHILEQYACEPIDFLSIDVEGSERVVLESFSLRRWQPTIVVIEATKPGSPQATHTQWEELILQAGYTLGLFDGLNRFYARDDQTLQRLSVPANTFDRYIPNQYWRLLSPRIRQQLARRHHLPDGGASTPTSATSRQRDYPPTATHARTTNGDTVWTVPVGGNSSNDPGRVAQHRPHLPGCLGRQPGQILNEV